MITGVELGIDWVLVLIKLGQASAINVIGPFLTPLLISHP